ncbi:MAG TPA: hypothetical protein PK404_05340, partial [Fervidobacterium sp.]|nr:hypothetical protein [Fervidobacterium sp.]
MKKVLPVLFVLVVSLMSVAFAGTLSIPVNAGDVEVPVVVQMSKLLDYVPEDFDADWSTMKILSNGKEIPYQVEDVDGNNRISAPDYVVFIASGKSQIVVSEEASAKTTVYPKAFTVTKTDTGWTIKSTDNKFEVAVNDHGLVQVTQFGDAKAKLIDELGIARVSGWYNSTFYVDGNLGDHYEETSSAFRVVSIKVLEPGPVAVGIVATLKSEKFNGLTQQLVTHIFKNGDILVDNTIVFETYADMMKVQAMATRPIAPAFDDAVHMLPVFRR